MLYKVYMQVSELQDVNMSNQITKTAVKRKNKDEYINRLTSVRLDEETERRLKATIESLNISQSAFVRRAIQNALADAEDRS